MLRSSSWNSDGVCRWFSYCSWSAIPKNRTVLKLDLTKEYLFPGRHGRGHIHKASADKILRLACLRVGLEGFSTHSFRRTALTQMHNAGVPTRHIQSISGHRTLAALARYLDVTEEQKQSAISALNF
ncbi:MAG: tyrosine-type recombinase/integrase [Chroococcidiopsidaceae cyanobacterium CP_BM_RX_35]|nr:tyrosine-type recombinase/integrase [Chroococcidiopsidaceae cyanobacterium CP_BM_RX_35]